MYSNNNKRNTNTLSGLSQLSSLQKYRDAPKVVIKKSDMIETDSLPGAGIQLNDRQRKLLAARKSVGSGNGNTNNKSNNDGGSLGGGKPSLKEQNHALPITGRSGRQPMISSYGGSYSKSIVNDYNSKKNKLGSYNRTTATATQQQYLGEEPTYTADTVQNTFSEDTSSLSSYRSRTITPTLTSTGSNNGSSSQRDSGSTSTGTTASQFYGQRLEGEEKKLYDDSGATWNDSQSEASSSATTTTVATAATAKSIGTKQQSLSSQSSAVGSNVSISSRTSSRTTSTVGSLSRLRLLQLERDKIQKNKVSSNRNNDETRSTASGVTSSSIVSATSTAIAASSYSQAGSSATSASVSQKNRRQDHDEKGSASALSSKKEPPTSHIAPRKSEQSSIATTRKEIQKQSFTGNKLSAASLLKQQQKEEKPLALHTQKDKDTFLRRTMMQWAKPNSSSSSSSVVSGSSQTSKKSALKLSSSSSIVELDHEQNNGIKRDPSGENSTTSSQIQQQRQSSKSSRRISWVPKKTIIPNRSPRRRGQQPLISPKEMAAMKKGADRIRKFSSSSSVVSSSSSSGSSGHSSRRAAGKMIKSTSSRMKKLISSSSSSTAPSSSLKVDREKEVRNNSQYETVESKKHVVIDGHDDAAPEDENTSSLTPKACKVDNPHAVFSPVYNRRPIELAESPLVLEDLPDNDDDEAAIIIRNKRMRKKSTRGRSSMFKKKLGGMVMGVMDDLIEENEALSSDEESNAEEVGQEENDLKKARSIRSQAYSNANGQQQEQCSPNIDRIVEKNKDFLHTMREGPLKGTIHQDKSLSWNAMSGSYDEETEDYNHFANTLKSELATSYVESYDSFYAMFHEENGKKSALPTKPLSVYPGSLDLKSKEAISSMSKYLTTEYNVECMIGSQIIKDDQYHVHRHNNSMKNSNNCSANGYPPKKLTSRRSKNGVANGDQIEDYRSILSVSSMDSINAGPDGSDYEVTLGQHIRKHESSLAIPAPSGSFDSSNDSVGELVSFTSVKLRSRSPISSQLKDEEHIPNSWTKVRLKPVAKAGHLKIDPNADTAETAEFHRIVLKKTPTNFSGGNRRKKSFNAPINTVTSSVSDVSGTDNKPINLDELRGSENRPIKLSPISGTEEKPITIKNVRKGGEDNPIKLAPSIGYDEGNPIKLVPSTGYEDNPIEMAPSIDLNLNEGSIMIPLIKEDSSGSNVDTSVLIGKNGITKVQSSSGEQQTSNKANVIWRIERGDVKSALLDMSSFHVKVIVASDDKGHKGLSFPTSAQCMRFANALHEMKNGNSKTNGSGSSSLASIDESSTTGTDDSVYVEQLSDDEQKVLDEFRQRKKNNKYGNTSNDNKEFTKDLLSKNILATIGGVAPTETKPMSVVNTNAVPSSPLSEVSNADLTLSQSETKLAFKYQMMLKMMKVPAEEVKQKMEEDQQVNRKIIDFVLGKSLTADNEKESIEPASIGGGDNLSSREETIASTYRKMLKMRIPLDAVHHKMKKDGVSPNIVSAVLGNCNEEIHTTATKPDPPSSNNLTLAEQAAAQSYKKMLKMCIPKEAVEHKMKKDGVNQKVISFILGIPYLESDAISSKKKGASSLNEKDESTAASYRKLIKMSIPKDAVHHKMKKDGVSEKIIAAVLGENKTNVPGKDAKQQMRGGFKAGFHWSPIADDESIAGSVWSKAKTTSEPGGKLFAPAIDISKHVELFQKKPDNAAEKKKKAAKSATGCKEMAKLIDLNRANNVAITLKAFNDFSYRQLSQIIEFLDPFGKIHGDRALFMRDLLPSVVEAKAIKSYRGRDENLVLAEKWFKHIVHIKRIEEKVEVMRTIETFKMDALVLGKSFQLLTEVCNQVVDSDRLPDLLDMVRQIGNRMNEGRGEEAVGFKMDFLPRLAQTKGSDKRTTALDLVVLIFCTRNQREALQLSGDFPAIQDASRIQFSDLSTDVRNLEASFRKCKTEFERLEKELDAGTNGTDSNYRTINNFKNNNTNGLSLHAAIKARHGSNNEDSDTPSVSEVLSAIQKSTTEQRRSLSPRASLTLAAKEKKHGEMEFSLDASIRRLEQFVGEVKYRILPQLEADRLAAVEACNDLASFFCESGGEKVASNLLKIIGGFATGIDQAVKRYDEKQILLARKEAAMKKRKTAVASSTISNASIRAMKGGKFPTKVERQCPLPENSKAPPSLNTTDQGEKKSLVLMVNEMLKVAGDKDIEDFVQGNFNENPDNRFKQIYQAEQDLKFNSARDVNILSAIKKRRSVSTNPVPRQALSELRATLLDTRDELDSVLVSNETMQHENDKNRGNRKSRGASRWTRKEPPIITKDKTDSEILSSLSHDTVDDATLRPKGRKSQVVDRWNSKNKNCGHSDTVNNERTDSEILTASSHDTNDVVNSRRRRQSYVNRWTSKSSVPEASTKDLDEESDIGAFQEIINKRKQNAINRWSSRPSLDRK